MASSGVNDDEIFTVLEDFASKENWDKFFTIRGSGDSFEWYADWSSIRDHILSQLAHYASSNGLSSSEGGDGGVDGGGPEILVPGCGSSSVSEQLYDAGFRRITNIDFSKVIVADMLRRHVRERPEMKWRVVDMTDMKLFPDEYFGIVVDKGGLDALMEPKHGPVLGIKYLKEMTRVLKTGGRFLCFSLAESNVIELILSQFRFGWETSIKAIPLEASKKFTFQTFMVVAVKQRFARNKPIELLFDQSTLDGSREQICSFLEAIKTENELRKELSVADVLHSLKDLLLGARGNLKELQPGRRFSLVLGEEGVSIYNYKAVVLDALPNFGPFLYHCAVFIVPKVRAREWLFCIEGGQWTIVKQSKAARLIIVFLDARHSHSTMIDIQNDLSPLVTCLAPQKPNEEAKIPFLMAGDDVRQKNILKMVTSTITGPIIVEDVKYMNMDRSGRILPDRDFRRLKFERSSGLIQSEAPLLQDTSLGLTSEEKGKGGNLALKSRKREGRKKNNILMSMQGSGSILSVDHTWLASLYHNGIVSGFALISSSISNVVSLGEKVRIVIVGLGAGVLPMFLRRCFHFLHIEVVELDPVVLDLAKEYFSFQSDEHLKVHICDGIKFIQDKNLQQTSANPEQNDHSEPSKDPQNFRRLRILVVDADSSDLSTGLTCPPEEFVFEPFLLSAKEYVSDGLFVINLVCRLPTIRDAVVSRLKLVFNHVFSLELGEDVNEVLFASPADNLPDPDNLPEAAGNLQSLMSWLMPEPLNMHIRRIKRL